MTSDEIRQSFLKFFENKGHKIVPGISLIPHGDPTLLLTSAGMVQFKPYFLGLEKPPSLRLTSCQKCFRATDIDVVGDGKHLTFFEMLGNFSVGDYFKKETISWSWQFVTEQLKLPKERLWVTIYLDDEEAFACWRQIGVPADRILRFGDEDNFWGPAGDSGPCGPCSEIYYDMGEKIGCGRPECKPNCDCDRFSEIWNLVFTQYNQHPDGSRTSLPKPNIDTGMGLERIVAAVQGKPSIYETELFSPLIQRVCQLTGKHYAANDKDDNAIRIIAEHTRGITFLIADGVLPSNEGRGYVLRRLLRRASLFGRKLGLDKPFLHGFAELVIDNMGYVYPELPAKRDLICKVTEEEENKLIATLNAGLVLVEGAIDAVLTEGMGSLSGEQVFKFYDTYGFPPEMTAEIAKERGLTIDWESFEAEMGKQRERARTSQKLSVGGGIIDLKGELRTKLIKVPTCFVGYGTNTCQSKILELRIQGQPKETASQGDEVDIIVDRTPFYGEMGGQTGDSGEMNSNKGKVVIADATRIAGDAIAHRGRVAEGRISVGDEVEARVNVSRRLDIARNHTATHLLQAALRQILGERVSQRGSLVEPDRLRFDFSWMATITAEQYREIQRWVNEKVRQNLPVKTKVTSYRQAIAEGAIALFEEKYGDQVRVVEIGELPISKELCGGTHVKLTGEIGSFLAVGESSVGAGLRRIEAVTGRTAELVLEKRLGILHNMAEEIGSTIEGIPDKVRTLNKELEIEHKRSLLLERELSHRMAESLFKQTKEVSGIRILTDKVPLLTMPVLREMGDVLREKIGSGIVVLATISKGKPNFVAMVTPDLVAKGFHAGDIVKQVAKVVGGGGGGKATTAEAGGKDVAKLDEALDLVSELVRKKTLP
ncbi:MAG: alanine--tRNA ligase [Dehalococcoidia bacterium]|nr:alanine--tRNA ligase [Dehalococcoidia bacterium]